MKNPNYKTIATPGSRRASAFDLLNAEARAAVYHCPPNAPLMEKTKLFVYDHFKELSLIGLVIVERLLGL